MYFFSIYVLSTVPFLVLSLSGPFLSLTLVLSCPWFLSFKRHSSFTGLLPVPSAQLSSLLTMPCPWTCGCTFLNPWRGVQQGPCLLHWPFHRSEFWIEKICKQKKGTATRKGKTYIMCWQFCLSSNKVLRLAGKLNLLTISPRTTTGKRDMTAAAILDQVYGRGDDDDERRKTLWKLGKMEHQILFARKTWSL